MVVDKPNTEIIADIKIDIHQIDQINYMVVKLQITIRILEYRRHAKNSTSRKRNLLINQNLSITTKKKFLKMFE